MSLYASNRNNSGGGVPIYPTLADFPATAPKGSLAVAADSGILYEFNGTTWVAIGGPGSVLSVGPIDSVPPSSNGAVISADVLIMQSASASDPGLVNLTTQTFAGQKTFSTGLTGTLTGHASLDVPLTEVGAANGVASLDGSGKVPASQLPSTVLEYQGLWNPTTNTPTLQDSTGTNGFVYQVSAAFAGPIAGLSNATMVNFQVGNLIIYAGSISQWEQAASLSGVTSVNGSVGAVTVNAINQLTGDITAGPASGSQSQVSTLVATTNSTLTTLSALSLPSSQLTGQVSIAHGGTGQATASAAFTALSPITTTGDIIYSSSGTTNSRLAIGSTGNVLTVSGGVPTWAAPATGGTVTSVGLTVPSFLSVTPASITTSGTFAVSLSGTALPNTSGGTGQVNAWNAQGVIYASNTSTLASTAVGTSGYTFQSQGAGSAPHFAQFVAVANGGTGVGTAAAAYNALSPMTTTGDIEYESGTNTASRLAIGTTGQVLTVSGGIPVWAASGSATTANSYSGYHNNNAAWSQTATSYGAMTSTGATPTLTKTFGSGITVTTAGSNAPGITFTPTTTTATYLISAKIFAQTSASSVVGNYRLTDGTNIVDYAQIYSGSAGALDCVTLTGVYTPGVTSAVSLTVAAAVSGTTGTCFIEPSGTLTPSITWTIVQIAV